MPDKEHCIQRGAKQSARRTAIKVRCVLLRSSRENRLNLLRSNYFVIVTTPMLTIQTCTGHSPDDQNSRQRGIIYSIHGLRVASFEGS